MFGGIPKLFDRAFFIGFFLPAFLLATGIGADLFAFDYTSEKFPDALAKTNTAGATIFLGIVWLLSILLMTFNRPIIRLLEGYGSSNPFRILLPRQRQAFKARAEPHFQKVSRVLEARRQGIPEPEEFWVLPVWEAARDFPEDHDLVMPTRLGNAMRAYERYSDVVYGIEAVTLWPRLFMIIPEEARERIRESEALFHFAINMLFISTLILATSSAMVLNQFYHSGGAGVWNLLSWPIMLVWASAVFFAWFSWWVLPVAARQRGEQVKSTFDLYRGMLADALGFELPATVAEEQKMWTLVSRRMMLRVSDYRLPGYKKVLDDFRKKEAKASGDGETSVRVVKILEGEKQEAAKKEIPEERKETATQ
jgi:hypothetical protein